MKSIIRRITAVLLCAMLALAAPLAAAQDVSALQAQVTATLEDGSPLVVDAVAVVTTLGDTIFWVDTSYLSPEQVNLLSGGRFVLTDDMGMTVADIALSGEVVWPDNPTQLTDSATGARYNVILATFGAPMSGEEADDFFCQFGFMTPDPYEEEPEPTEEPTPEPTEEPTPEPTPEPTEEPTPEPTPEPTEEPTPEPTEEPTPEPTEEPTPEPTEEPTPEPTEEPTPEPTEEPTPEPTAEPAAQPEQEPEQPPVEETAEPAGQQEPTYAITNNARGGNANRSEERRVGKECAC